MGWKSGRKSVRSDAEKFHNNCRILFNLDIHDFIDFGVIENNNVGHSLWIDFSADPLKVMLRMGDAKYDALWALIESRQPKEKVDA
jgi:hypothetical protein